MTAVYSAETLQQKLAKLVNTQETQPHRKLFFLNLANDVIQTGKKKGDAFSPEFEKVLPGAFENTFQFERLIRFVNQDLKKQVKRIVAIWRERKIYSTEYLNKLEEKAGLGTSSPKKEKSVVIPELKAMLPLLELLRVIQKDQLDEVTRISAIRPVLYLPDEVPHINDTSQLELNAGELVEGIKMVQTFEFMLDREIKTRQQLIDECKKLIDQEEKGMKAAEEKRLEMKGKREIMLKVEQMTRNKINNPNQVNPATLERLNAFKSDDDDMAIL